MSMSPSAITKRRLTASGFAIVIGTLIFSFALHSILTQRDLAHVDLPILEWLLIHRSTELTTLMQVITTLAAPLTLAIVSLIGAFIWIWRTKDIWRPFLFVSAMVLAFIVSSMIKLLVARGRPPTTDMIPPLELDYSFPSGHTIGIAVCLLALGYLVYTKHRTSSSILIWVSTAIVGISAVALSRLYLGYHWVTDITASIGLALIILGIIMLLDTSRPKRLLGQLK